MSSNTIEEATTAELEFQVAKLEMQPGDVLVVSMSSRNYTPHRAHHLFMGFKSVLPEGTRLVVVEEGTDLSVITPPPPSGLDPDAILDKVKGAHVVKKMTPYPESYLGPFGTPG